MGIGLGVFWYQPGFTRYVHESVGAESRVVRCPSPRGIGPAHEDGRASRPKWGRAGTREPWPDIILAHDSAHHVAFPAPVTREGMRGSTAPMKALLDDPEKNAAAEPRTPGGVV